MPTNIRDIIKKLPAAQRKKVEIRTSQLVAEKLLPENRQETKALLKDLAKEQAGRPAKMLCAFDLKDHAQSLDVKAARKKNLT